MVKPLTNIDALDSILTNWLTRYRWNCYKQPILKVPRPVKLRTEQADVPIIQQDFPYLEYWYEEVGIGGEVWARIKCNGVVVRKWRLIPHG